MNHQASAHAFQPHGQDNKAWSMDLTPLRDLLEGVSSYSIIFSLLGIGGRCIEVDVDLENREVAVTANRQIKESGEESGWAFRAPEDADLSRTITTFNAGLLEIFIPKMAESGFRLFAD